MPPTVWFRLLVAVTAILALGFIAAIVAGRRLPAEQVASGTVYVSMKPEALWQRLDDVEGYPRAALIPRSVERLEPDGGKPRWRELLTQSVATWTTDEWEPMTRRVDQGIDSGAPQRTVWTFELAPEEDGTRLTFRIATIVEGGGWMVPVFRMILRAGGTRVAMQGYLKNTLPDFDDDSIRWDE